MTNSQRKIFWETKPFSIPLNNIKYLGVTLTRQVKECMINLETLKRVPEDERASMLWVSRINLVTRSNLPKVVCRFYPVHIKTPT